MVPMTAIQSAQKNGATIHAVLTQLHADLTMLARLSEVLTRCRGVTPAA